MNSYSFIFAGVLASGAILALGIVFVLGYKVGDSQKINSAKSSEEHRKVLIGIHRNSLALFLIHWLFILTGGFCSLLLACVWLSEQAGNNNIGNLFSMPILLGIIIFSLISLIFTSSLRNRESTLRSMKKIETEENE